MFLNPDKSLDEIIHSRTNSRQLKRLNQLGDNRFRGINTIGFRMHNLHQPEDARYKIHCKMQPFQDLRNKLVMKSFSKPIHTENMDYSSLSKDDLLSSYDDFGTNSITGLPSYHETKKIQITIKGLNKPKADFPQRTNDYKLKDFPIVREPFFLDAPHVQNSQYFAHNHIRASNQLGIDDYSRNSTIHRHTSTPHNKIPSVKNLVSGTKLIISNLSSSVTRRDITELCEAIGRVESVLLHQCIAHIKFTSKHSAMEAYKTYHNRHLDGKAMVCRISSSYNLNSHASVSPLLSKSFRDHDIVNTLYPFKY
eukprot:TRINITY_DN830_c0_g4_i1.p1 TRINITY_DN830_c0_g4~~TRINITY_DN830_c0_g4_i1.p1  ORF type:complete len:309 (-),score=-2.74 TRINITY_DN830_c0_g4_i1:85-1011(-)